MQIDFFYKNTDNAKEKAFIVEYVEQKRVRFEKLIEKGDYQVARLKVKAETFASKGACQVELVLDLPKQKYMSSEDDHTWREAIDLAVDKMIIQLRKDRDKAAKN